MITPGDASLEDLLAQAEGGIYVTDVAGLHSGVNPVSGTFSVGAPVARSPAARSANRTPSSRSPRTWSGCSPRSGRPARETRWVPFGGSVKSSALLIGEMAVGGS